MGRIPGSGVLVAGRGSFSLSRRGVSSPGVKRAQLHIAVSCRDAHTLRHGGLRPMMNSGVPVRLAVSLGPLGAPLPSRPPYRLSGSSGLRPPLTYRPFSCRGPALSESPLRTGLAQYPGTGRPTDTGHDERRHQVQAELLAPGPRAGRTGPGVLPLSAGGLCVRVPRPHHPPLGPRQVSPGSCPQVAPGCVARFPESGKRVTLPCQSCRLSLPPVFPLLSAPFQFSDY